MFEHFTEFKKICFIIIYLKVTYKVTYNCSISLTQLLMNAKYIISKFNILELIYNRIMSKYTTNYR